METIGRSTRGRRRFGAFDIEVNDNRFLAAADHDCLHRLVGPRIHLLVRYVGRNIDEVARSRLFDILQLIAPAEARPSADDVQDGFQFAMVVSAGPRRRLHNYSPRP